MQLTKMTNFRRSMGPRFGLGQPFEDDAGVIQKLDMPKSTE